MPSPQLKDVLSMSVLDSLYRFAELYNLDYTPSNRTRRACVAFIFRVATKNSPVCENANSINSNNNN